MRCSRSCPLRYSPFDQDGAAGHELTPTDPMVIELEYLQKSRSEGHARRSTRHRDQIALAATSQEGRLEERLHGGPHRPPRRRRRPAGRRNGAGRAAGATPSGHFRGAHRTHRFRHGSTGTTVGGSASGAPCRHVRTTGIGGGTDRKGQRCASGIRAIHYFGGTVSPKARQAPNSSACPARRSTPARWMPLCRLPIWRKRSKHMSTTQAS
jgi:hypothetical protein